MDCKPLEWICLGSILAKGWPAGELRQLLAQLQATDFTYGPERKLWAATQIVPADSEAVRRELVTLGAKFSDGTRWLEAVVAAVREAGDQQRRRDLVKKLDAARIDPVTFDRILDEELRKRELPSVAGRTA